MQFRIERTKFLEGLAKVSKALIAAQKKATITLFAGIGSNDSLESHPVYIEGLIAEFNDVQVLECPYCGGEVTKTTQPGGKTVFACDGCKAELQALPFMRKTYFACEKQVAEFVKKSLGLPRITPLGDGNYRLGKYHGRNVFFCVSPSEGFFNSHNRDAIVIVCDVATVPGGWASHGCLAIPFTEMFSVSADKTSIRIDEDILDELNPTSHAPRFTGTRRIHSRRDKWLSVLMNMLSEKRNPKDFKNGFLSVAGACRWFGKLYPEVNVCRKTFARDLNQLQTFDPEKDKYDMRQPQIVKLIRIAADPKVSQQKRLSYVQKIADEISAQENKERKNGGRRMELSPWGWINDGDRSVAVPASALTEREAYDKFLADMGERPASADDSAA